MRASFLQNNGLPYRVLSVREREFLRQRIAENEARVRGEIVIAKNPKVYEKGMSERRAGRYAQFLNPAIRENSGLIKQKIEQDRKILDAGSPRDLNRAERKALEETARRQREWLQRHMAGRKDAEQMPVNRRTGIPNPKFREAVEKFKREHDPRFKKIASEYVNNMRQLAADSPDAASLEAIRPK